MTVEAPWRLDPAVPINFRTAHIDHAGILGSIESHQTDRGFCVPLWAEGYGGAQLFGTAVDAGMVGVISGTVEFGVVKTDATVARVPVKTGPVTKSQILDISLPTPDQYELHLKLRGGEEQTFTGSGSLGNVTVDWATGKVELRSKPIS